MSETAEYQISSQSCNFFHFDLPYWIRNFEFHNIELEFVIRNLTHMKNVYMEDMCQNL